MRLAIGVLLGFAGGYVLATRREQLGAMARRTSELGDLTRDELYKRAQAEEVPGRSTMTNEELRDALDTSGGVEMQASRAAE